jgi:hypothetical protein
LWVGLIWCVVGLRPPAPAAYVQLREDLKKLRDTLLKAARDNR